MADDEELYDDATSALSTGRKSGLNDLLSKFESKDDKPPDLKPFGSLKPNPATKPAPNPKIRWGQNTTGSTDNKTKSPNEDTSTKQVPPWKTVNRPSQSSTNSENSIANKRMSNNNIKIPSAFQISSEENSGVTANKVPMKPKLPYKPAASDGNNNASKVPKQLNEVKVESQPLSNGSVSNNGVTKKGSVSELQKKLFERGGGISNFSANSNGTAKPITPPKKLTHVKSPTEEIASVQLRSKNTKPLEGKHPQVRRQSVKRQDDGKRFYKVEITVLDDAGPPPNKPDKLDCEIDLESLITDYKAIVKNLKISETVNDDIEEELYEDAVSENPRANAISMIRPMSEGEESREFNLPLPPQDLLVPQADDWPDEAYCDGESVNEILGQSPKDEGGEELYEPLDEVLSDESPPSIPSKGPSSMTPEAPSRPPPTPKDKAKDPKQLDKEKKQKKKEEEEKRKQQEREAEKMRKQKEKEIKALVSQFKKDQLKDKDLQGPFAQGTVKVTAKGSHKNDLSVQEGEIVEIIKMDLKEAGKWIVRCLETQKVGYVAANNVEVETGSIRGLMEVLSATSPKTSSSSISTIQDVGGEEFYEDIPGEGEAAEDIYELVPES